jgi:hypothetical protein
MMGEPVDVVAEAEEYVSALRREWVAPRDRECVACYVGRMLDEFGCDNRLRWVGLWRDECAPRATALERRLSSRGGFCDCEVALNVYPEQMLLAEDEPRPPCDGVSRRGSTMPCRR